MGLAPCETPALCTMLEAQSAKLPASPRGGSGLLCINDKEEHDCGYGANPLHGFSRECGRLHQRTQNGRWLRGRTQIRERSLAVLEKDREMQPITGRWRYEDRDWWKTSGPASDGCRPRIICMIRRRERVRRVRPLQLSGEDASTCVFTCPPGRGPPPGSGRCRTA